jgi:hypothetical protein
MKALLTRLRHTIPASEKEIVFPLIAAAVLMASLLHWLAEK